MENKEFEASLTDSYTPKEIVEQLDKYIVGQKKAKKEEEIPLKKKPNGRF